LCGGDAMPLKKPKAGASKKAKREAASKNISELSDAHPEWPKAPRVAAGLNAAGLSKKRRGKTS
jgi:hypothetical protein